MGIKTIAITGSNGYIATNIIRGIIRETSWNIFAFTSNVEGFVNESPDRIFVRDNSLMENVFSSEDNIDFIIHCAFSRRFSNNTQIAYSLNYSEYVYRIVRKHPNCKVINISSVGVYGVGDDFQDETKSPNPDSIYAMAKYASEILLEAIFDGESKRYVNMRIAGVPQSQKIPKLFIQSAISDKCINIIVPPVSAGEVRFSWISINDIVSAVLCLMKSEKQWSSNVYNISRDKENYSIQNVAHCISGIVEECGYGNIAVNITEGKAMNIFCGWSSSLFSKEFNWNANHDLRDIMIECFNEFVK